MKKKVMITVTMILVPLFNFSCARNSEKTDPSQMQTEIRQVENNFMNDLNSKGVAYAFHEYASDNAVIKRENDSLIIGKKAIREYYSNAIYQNATAVWEPDFIDVSEEGNLAYTYGKYSWEFIDSVGILTTYKGVFHTVWKRLPDGSWKYVWD